MPNKVGGKRDKLTIHELQRTIEVFEENDGKVKNTAEALGITRQATRNRLKRAEEAGLINAARKTPNHHETKVYVLTSAQDDTPVFTKFWDNLLAYVDKRGAELMIAGYTYSKNMFVSEDNTRSHIYDPRLEPYMVTEKRMITPGNGFVHPLSSAGFHGG